MHNALQRHYGIDEKEALTASELAALAGISRSTARGHLGKLAAAQLVAVTQKRRNRYYRIASPLVARMLESIKAVAALETPARNQPRSAQDDALRFARSCYDHLADRLGVALADALVAKKFVVLSEEGGALTARGQKFLCDFGADLTAKSGSRRIFCRACLDWSERRRHIAGLAGAAILTRLVALNWLARARGSRALRLTPAGQRGLREAFGIADGRAKIQLT